MVSLWLDLLFFFALRMDVLKHTIFSLPLAGYTCLFMESLTCTKTSSHFSNCKILFRNWAKICYWMSSRVLLVVYSLSLIFFCWKIMPSYTFLYVFMEIFLNLRHQCSLGSFRRCTIWLNLLNLKQYLCSFQCFMKTD